MKYSYMVLVMLLLTGCTVSKMCLDMPALEVEQKSENKWSLSGMNLGFRFNEECQSGAAPTLITDKTIEITAEEKDTEAHLQQKEDKRKEKEEKKIEEEPIIEQTPEILNENINVSEQNSTIFESIDEVNITENEQPEEVQEINVTEDFQLPELDELAEENTTQEDQVLWSEN